MTSSDTDYSINNKIITRFIKCSLKKKSTSGSSFEMLFFLIVIAECFL